MIRHCSTTLFSLLFLVASGFGCLGQVTLPDVLNRCAIDLLAFSQADLSGGDSLLNKQKDYLAVYAASGDPAQILAEARLFQNNDQTFLLTITSYAADEQCGWYETVFFLIDHTFSTPQAIASSDLLPIIQVTDLLDYSIVTGVLEKYLPCIQRDYLGSEAGLHEVVEELFSIRYRLDERKPLLHAELEFCDYIPTNVCEIVNADLKALMEAIRPIKLYYNPKNKHFSKKS